MLILPIRLSDNRLNCTGVQRSCAPSFQSNTSAGAPLRKLKGLKCPYFGVEMILSSDMPKIENAINECSDTKSILKLLKKHKKHMQKIEKRIFNRFEKAFKTNPDLTLPDFLKLWYDEAITKLKLEEFDVLDDVDKISLKLSPDNALAIHIRTTHSRQTIIENRKEDTFKRKTLITSLDEIIPQKGEKYILEMLKARAAYLPTSGTSPNAFIVKYADRTEEEIAKRLLRPSVATIEHIKPDSKGGLNAIGNFLLASAGANSMRSNMPLVDFIMMFPKIPKYCQEYVEQIFECIRKGKLKGNETYPYKIQRTLDIESKGVIRLDLTHFGISKEEAKQAVRRFLNRYKK